MDIVPYGVTGVNKSMVSYLITVVFIVIEYYLELLESTVSILN